MHDFTYMDGKKTDTVGFGVEMQNNRLATFSVTCNVTLLFILFLTFKIIHSATFYRNIK